MKMQLSEDDLCTMIVQALPFSPDGITAKISKDGIVSLGASVQKQSLVDSGLATGGMRTAVLFLPDPCKVYSVWNISAESGSIKLDCATMEIVRDCFTRGNRSKDIRANSGQPEPSSS